MKNCNTLLSDGAINNPGETKFTYAVLFYYMGVRLAPCQPGKKDFLPGYGPYKNYICDEPALWQYFHEDKFNYAILTGTGNLVVIDFDDLDVYHAWAEDAGELANTFTVQTHRGRHVYYQSDDLRSWRGNGFEVMGSNRAVMGPLSRHPAGDIYTPLTRPYIRKIETLSRFSLLSTPPSLPKPPAIRPLHLGGGLVQKLKEKTPIFDAIQTRQDLAARVRLKNSDNGHGRWFKGYCPFHADNHPSFWIDTQKQTYGCRACDAKGDVLNLIAWAEGKDLEAVINDLRGTL